MVVMVTNRNDYKPGDVVEVNEEHSGGPSAMGRVLRAATEAEYKQALDDVGYDGAESVMRVHTLCLCMGREPYYYVVAVD